MGLGASSKVHNGPKVAGRHGFQIEKLGRRRRKIWKSLKKLKTKADTRKINRCKMTSQISYYNKQTCMHHLSSPIRSLHKNVHLISQFSRHLLLKTVLQIRF